jgi:hypothetical protein
MEQELFAFWKYDLPPYALCGKISKIDEAGRVYVVAFQGWFKPILILPLAEGLELKSKLKEAASEYENAVYSARASLEAKLYELGVPR